MDENLSARTRRQRTRSGMSTSRTRRQRTRSGVSTSRTRRQRTRSGVSSSADAFLDANNTGEGELLHLLPCTPPEDWLQCQAHNSSTKRV